MKCLHLARVGRPDILWSVNKLARSVTNWSGVCDKRLARLISYIHHTSEYRQHCHMGKHGSALSIGLFQDSDFAGHLEDSKSTSEGSYVSLKVEHSSPIVGCARNKRQYPTVPQDQKSFRWMLDCRMDGLPALDLWDVVMEVLRSSNNTKPPTNPATGNCSRNHTTNAHSSQGGSQLYIFENNEALIKIIIKGRSPTIRHVSRTHRVALDWLFDRITLDPKIQIKCVDTKKQLAEMLTKRNFTVTIFFISPISCFSRCFPAANFLSNRKQSATSKRAQESTPNVWSAVAKPRPMILVSRNLLSAMKDHPQNSSDPNSPRNQELDQSSVSSRDKKLKRNINPTPTMYSQERH